MAEWVGLPKSEDCGPAPWEDTCEHPGTEGCGDWCFVTGLEEPLSGMHQDASVETMFWCIGHRCHEFGVINFQMEHLDLGKIK